MRNIFMSEIISSVGATTTNYEHDFVVNGISTDTRSLKKGDLFIALIGPRYDGHEFVSIAQAKGACAVICSNEIYSTLPTLTVKDTLVALQDLATYYRTKFDIPVVAITGSNGKTTTKNMIATVLSAHFRVFFADKNLNNEIGLPKSILELDDSYTAAVFEMGMNHFGEIETLSKDIGKMARDGFNLTFEKGWYSLEEQQTTKLNEEHTKFSTKAQNFN